MSGRRYPFQALEVLIAHRLGPRSVGSHLPADADQDRWSDRRPVDRDGWTDHDLADLLGITRTTVRQHRRRGLSWRQADQLATAAGYHPLNVWPDWCSELDSTPAVVGGDL